MLYFISHADRKHRGKARDLVRRSSGVQRTRLLASQHADKAREVLDLLPDSNEKKALETLTRIVVSRKW